MKVKSETAQPRNPTAAPRHRAWAARFLARLALALALFTGAHDPVALAAPRTYFMYFNAGTTLTQPPVTTNTTCPSARDDTTLGAVSGIGLMADADDLTCVPDDKRDVIWDSASATLALHYDGAGYPSAMDVTGTSVGIRARGHTNGAILVVRLFYTTPANAKVYFTGTPPTQAVSVVRSDYAIDLSGLSAANVPAGSKIGVEFSWPTATGMRLSVNQSASNDKLVVDEVPVGATDLAIAKSHTGDFTAGQQGTYDITVSNNGPQSVAGPITVIDTLPASLGFVSATGTGWSCGAVAAEVTCSHPGPLAAGAALPTLSLVVLPTAAGTVTNSATVSSTTPESLPANNTADDPTIIVAGPSAYYLLDEAAWNAGTVIDATGANDGTALGSVTPTGFPPPSPPGGAVPGSPGTCGAASLSGTAGTHAIDTGIDFNTLGNAGTVSFWYSSNTAWNDGVDRMLFDASNDLTFLIFSVDKHFYLVKEGSGRLRFALENTGDTDYEARSGAYTFAANTWHHIAVTWAVGTDRARLYVDGALADTSRNTSGSLGDVATLYLGDQRMSGITGTPGNYSANSANGYVDEARIFGQALAPAEIQAHMSATHPCGAPLDHIRIEHASGTGLTCNPDTLTLRACGDAACATAFTGGVTGTLTATGTPIVNWAGGADFSIPAGSDVITKGVHVTTAGSVVFGTLAGSVSPVPAGLSPTCNFGSPACTFTAADSGFLFDLPHHTSETAQAFTFSAVRKADNSLACVPAFASRTNVPVNFRCSYVNPGSGTLPVRMGQGNTNTPLAADAASACAAGGNVVSLDFDANGVAQDVRVIYADVGQMGLVATFSGAAGSSEEGLIMSGADGDGFIARPARFQLALRKPDGTLNPPMAVDPTGPVLARAGENFTVEVEALNALGGRTGNYGRESPAEGVKLTAALVEPAGGSPGAFAGTFAPFGLQCDGSGGPAGYACGTAFNWSEVGILALTPSVQDGDYLGAGDVSGSVVNPVGRFTPHHFDVTHNGPQFIAGCGGFTYLDQTFTYRTDATAVPPVAPQVTITARGVAGNQTSNYTGPWWKLAGLVNFTAADAGLPPGVTFGAGAAGHSAFDCAACNGALTTTLSGAYRYTRASAAVAPFAAAPVIGFDVYDSDNVAYGGALPGTYALPVTFFGGADSLRSGRAHAKDVYGGGNALTMTLFTQYFDGTSWVTNGADGCSGFGYTKTDSGLTTTVSGTGTFTAGSSSLLFQVTADDATPGGSSLATFDWTRAGAQSWLDIVATPDPESTPSATATFGVYRGDRRILHWREVP